MTVRLIVVFVAMASQDVLQALYTKALTARHPWRAGASDGLMDVLMVLGVFGVALAGIQHPWNHLGYVTALAAVLVVSSMIGTVIGYHFEDWIERR